MKLVIEAHDVGLEIDLTEMRSAISRPGVAPRLQRQNIFQKVQQPAAQIARKKPGPKPGFKKAAGSKKPGPKPGFKKKPGPQPGFKKVAAKKPGPNPKTESIENGQKSEEMKQ